MDVRGRLSRRDLLRASGVLALGAALAPCTGPPSRRIERAGPTAPGVRPDVQVVVVGAGLAGLTAAYRLHQVGIPTKVFEARGRLGGRCWTLRNFPHGQIAEHGGEFIDTRHLHLRGLVEELGLEIEDLWEGWVPGSASPAILDGEPVPRAVLDEGLEALIDTVADEARRAGIVVEGRFRPTSIAAGTASEAAVEMDRVSVEEWVERRLPGSWNTGPGRALAVALEGWYGLSPGGLSALNLVDYFLIPWKGADERYHVRGGNDLVVRRLAEAVPEGSVTPGAPLEALVALGDGRQELIFGGGVGRVRADRVILALSFTALRRVDLRRGGLSPAKLAAIRELAMGTNAKLHLRLSRQPERFAVQARPWNGGITDVDAGWIAWEAVRTQPGPGAVLTVYSGGRGAAPFAASRAHARAEPQLVEDTVARLGSAIPGVASAVSPVAFLDYWPADPWSMGSYAAFAPGQVTRFWGTIHRPEGGIHFAGEHTSTYSQGYLNGAVESGTRAAIEVMNALGVPVPERIASLPYTPALG